MSGSSTVCLTFDFDAISLWINTFKATTPTPISRGEYGARVGLPRILDVLARHEVRATFFVPGHTADVYPEAVEAIHRRGHEIAAHGYLHETPVGLALEQEIALFERAESAIQRRIGSRPRGYRSPAWDLSPNTISILNERGYLYDSSLMSDDFTPFRPRKGDRISPDGTVAWGIESEVLEFPVAWELDDFPHFAFVSRPMNVGLRDPRDVFDAWRAEFDYCTEHVPEGVFTLTMHPQIIGRGPRIALLDEFIAYAKQRPGVAFATMIDTAEAIVRRSRP